MHEKQSYDLGRRRGGGGGGVGGFVRGHIRKQYLLEL